MKKEIGNRIKERRKALGMTQEVLAEKSNVSRSRLSSIENGECNDVLFSTLTDIATALQTTVDFFLT